ncbi:MAG: hypothetical protein KAI17_18580 [Thiotrichaceae bacterium]|nr:hypothetical protein [Thiotrichaceae bacterium]
MRLSITNNKRMIIISLLATLLGLASLLVHDAYAAKSKISLNSPVSFPVDI